MASSVLESSEEKIYGFKLMRLLVDGGTEVLRNIFLSIHSGNLHAVLSTHHSTLLRLFTRKTNKIITQPQWDKLYPHPPAIPNIKDFDITLLVILLRNVCGLTSPATGWNNMPNSTDNSLEADIVRIKLFRNNYFGHIAGTGITRSEFLDRWTEVSSVLRRLGLNQTEIDRLKTEECGEEEVDRVRKEWNKSEKEVVSKIDRMEDKVEKLTKKFDEFLKQNKSFTKDILSECLQRHDFKGEIQSLYDNYTEGTREWIFNQVSKWLNDKLSVNRAFIISGQAGMGKSTVAAVTCKRFPGHFAACHFFQYNNSRYNDPKFLLQSLAWQLCHVIPEYKQNLTNNLSGNKAQSLNDQNVEGMFSMLFTEPFSNIPDPGKHFLIVIDALDECRREEKQKLVNLITLHFHKFHRFIRFLITTRSETNITHKFERLKPLFLQPDDEQNLNDLRLFFDDKLKSMLEEVSREELVNKLVDKSDGLMLYASFLCKLSEKGPIISKNEDLPVGIEEVYERYFKRLEDELRNLGVDEKQFLKFLSVIAVSKRPLPLALLEILFSTDKDLLIATRTLRKLIDCLSSLLVIKDESLLFFHKSVRDWLVKPNNDQFRITERYGHRALADFCVFQMQTLKKNEISLTFDPATVYVLLYGIQHILEAEIEDVHSLTKLISHVIDLEIVHASVCIDIYTTLSNLSSLDSYNIKNSLVCEKTQTTIKTLISIIRKFTYILKDVPHSFLQHVVNENDDILSPQATFLLMTRYQELAYFELEEKKKNTENGLIGRTFTENNILEIDISPSEDFLICGYEQGIELFSLSDFKSLWKIHDFVLEQISANMPPCYKHIPLRLIVFHPFENVIFPGQLTPVLNFKGKFESGKFMHEESPNKFTTSCFSHDKTKMVTNYGIHLTVWNLLENKKIVSLSCRSELSAILFSANDEYIGTTNFDGELFVYDTKNSYSMISKSFVGADNIRILVSTFNSDSWILVHKNNIYKTEIVKYDITIKPVPIKPQSQLFKSVYPANARAAAIVQAVIENDDDLWFKRLICYKGIFFILNDKRAFVYRKYKREIKLFGLPEFIPDSNTENLRKKLISSLFIPGRDLRFSVDGTYIYALPHIFFIAPISIVKLSCPGSEKSIFIEQNNVSFAVVTNGVFVCGEIRKSSTDKYYLSPGIPELWNFGVTERIASFPEMIGASGHVLVTHDLVGCVMRAQVCFFNVLKKAMVARTSFPEQILNRGETIQVIACSSAYHVLMGGINCAFLLQHANSVDLGSRIFNNTTFTTATFDCITVVCFSPNGQSLAFRLHCNRKMLYILDIPALNVRGKFSLYSAANKKTILKFVDEDHLLCEGYNDCLCLINVKTCEILTCINLNLREPVLSVFACHNTVGIFAYSHLYQNFKTIKLWLPQQRENKLELLECFCWIHGRI